MNYEFYMRKALDLAALGIGCTTPNPMVGAVIVTDDGRIVGEGFHQRAGTPHAEIHALKQAGSSAHGSTIFVTLEPCCHHGRTGPCTDALITAGIKKVVVAMTDPNPLVAGCGIKKLRNAGIEVVTCVLSADAAKLNEVFIKYITTKLPFGVLKTAMTLDGKIATSAGHSQWITDTLARERVHQLRHCYDGIMVGIGTLVADNPKLTTRLPDCNGKNPVRIVVDSLARTPLSANVITDGAARTIIAATSKAPEENIAKLENAGAEVLLVPGDESRVNLRELFKLLGNQCLTSILIEGGAQINSSALEANIVDKVCWFIAPKIVGGISAPGPIGGFGITNLNTAYLLEDLATEAVGHDLLITGYLKQREARDVYRSCGRIG